MDGKLYVGNLHFTTTDQELHDHFASQATVILAKVITDRLTGRSRGLGFVEMSTQDEAEQAISALNGTDLGGRILMINEARPLKERQQGRSDAPNTPSDQ